MLSSPLFWKVIKNQHRTLQANANERMKDISFTAPNSPFQSHLITDWGHQLLGWSPLIVLASGLQQAFSASRKELASV